MQKCAECNHDDVGHFGTVYMWSTLWYSVQVVDTLVRCTSGKKLLTYRGWRGPAVSLHPHGSRLLTIVHLNSCLMPPSPSFIPQGWRHFFRWTNWRLPDFSHLPYKVCNVDIFCPLSHRQPRQVKTCQPGQLRWSISFNLQFFNEW